MIAVDTSALMAIALAESDALRCKSALERASDIVISAGTVAEALIVASGRKVGRGMERLLNETAFEIVPVTEAAARRVAAAYVRWGKGFHPAHLKYGDCFAYEVATHYACPLLFVGDDFARTDVASAFQIP